METDMVGMEKQKTSFEKRVMQTNKGQALAEFTLILPVLSLILLAAYFVGAAMYTGANASSALRAALQSKSDYADSETALTNFVSVVNAYNTGTFRIPGDTIDTARVEMLDKPIAVLIAEKSVDFPLFPTFNFVITQGIKSNLLANNTGDNLTVADVPYDISEPAAAATILPTTYEFVSDVPLYVPINTTCQGDLSVFDQAKIANTCDGACRAKMTQDLFDAHIQHASALGGCGNGQFKRPTDVVFDTSPPSY